MSEVIEPATDNALVVAGQPTPEVGTELAVVRQSTSTIVALDKDDILGKLKAKLAALPTDISVKRNREAIAAGSHSVSTTKVALLKLADASVEDAKKTVKVVTTEKKALEELMDALRDQVRAPVTAWEQIEKDRVKAHEAALQAMSDLAALLPHEPTPEQVRESLDRLDLNEDGRDWQEFSQRANDLHAFVGFKLTEALKVALSREEAARETERKRLEEVEAARLAAEKAQREREARIAAEAAEAARKEAEARAAEAAAAERQRVERDRLDAEDARREAEIAAQAELDALEEANRIANERAREARDRAKRAEAERVASEQRAEQQRMEAQRLAEADRIAGVRLLEEARIAAEERQIKAIEAERKRAAEALAAEEEAAAERAKNTEIKRRVNFDAAAALIARAGLTEQQAQRVIVAIAKREVPAVRISY